MKYVQKQTRVNNFVLFWKSFYYFLVTFLFENQK